MASGKDVLKWLEKYEKKVGNSFFRDWDIGYYPCCYIFDDGSLFTYTVLGDTLEVGPVSIDFKKSYPIINEVAKILGCKRVTTITPRHIKPYLRLVKCKVIDSKVIDGELMHYVEREVY